MKTTKTKNGIFFGEYKTQNWVSKFVNDLHNLVIKFIVGKKTVVINANINGGINFDKTDWALISNNKLKF